MLEYQCYIKLFHVLIINVSLFIVLDRCTEDIACHTFAMICHELIVELLQSPGVITGGY